MTTTASSSATTTTTTTVVSSSKKFDTASITKLNGDNYRVWKLRLEKVLTSHRIMGIVDGSVPRPAAAGKDQEVWDQGDNEAYTAMLLTMSDDEVETISSSKTAHEIWTKLATMYLNVSGESQNLVYSKYFAVTATAGKSPVKTMIEIQNLASQLRSMGAGIDDKQEVCRVISSLNDDKFRNFREAWRSVDEPRQSTALLLTRLKTWELEEGEAYGASKPEEEAQQKAYSARRPGKTWKSKEELAEMKKNSKCNFCKKPGHWARECKARLKKQNQQQKDEKREHKEPKQDEGRACAAGSASDEWVNDSGASRQFCGRLDWFWDYEKYPKPKPATIADNSKMFAQGIGTVKIEALVGGRWVDFTLMNVEYVPKGSNLFSENVAIRSGLTVCKDLLDITYYRNGHPDIEAEYRGGVQVMKFRPVVNKALTCIVRGEKATWHERLGHINQQYLKNTADREAAYGLTSMEKDIGKCEICMQTKATKQSSPMVEKTVHYEVGECIHTDLIPGTMTSRRNNEHYLLIKDEESSFRQVYFQKTKEAAETLENIKDAVNFLENQTGNRLKIFRSDNGGEYKNKLFLTYFSEKGIQVGFNAPYAHESNGLVERDVRTVQESARAMLLQSELSGKHWDDAIRTAVYLLNRTLSSKNPDMTPFEMIFNKKPSLQHTKVFGTRAFALIPKEQSHGKWEKKTRDCILVGYSATTKNYVLYVPSERRYIEQARHVDFIETGESRKGSTSPDPEVAAATLTVTVQNQERTVSFPPPPDNEIVTSDPEADLDELVITVNQNEADLSWYDQVEADAIDMEEADDMEEANDAMHDEDTLVIPAVRRGERVRKQRDVFQAGFMARSGMDIPEPSSYREAVNSRDSGDWKEAMDAEMRSQAQNATWRLVKRPANRKVLKSRWVYKIKTLQNGDLDRFKARFVVKGYSQQEGIDYNETFAPVSRVESIRMLLSVAAAENLTFAKHFDVGTAFLNAPMEEEVYVEQPEGYEIGDDLVCFLLKALYGTKQAPRAWFEMMREKLEKMGFVPCENDPCVYVKWEGDDKIYIGAYVDDGLIIGREARKIQKELEALREDFLITVKPLTVFLGIEIEMMNDGIFIHQKKYVTELLHRYGMSQCKSIDTPMTPGLQLVGCSPPDLNYQYRELVGALLFLARCTRPDIAYPVNYLSRFLSNFGKEHWQHAKKILQYLQGTKEFGIKYNRNHDDVHSLTGYVDADYASDRQTRKSTTGCVFAFNDAPIIWMSRRQTCIALSSTEAEYVALSTGGKESVWIARMYDEFGISHFKAEPIRMLTDSQSAMKLSKNPELHDKSKHIDVRHHYIRWLVETKQVSVDHLPDREQPADLLTKAVGRENFLKKRYLLGVLPPPQQQPEKRRAMSSITVDPKRPNVFWSAMLLLFLFLKLGGASDLHASGSPVLWRKTNDPVVIGFNSVKLAIKLISPCTLIPLDEVESRLAKVLEKQCGKTYEDLFLGKLEKICPQQRSLFGRQKRELIMAVGFILVAMIASAGIGLGGYAISETYKVETKQDELKEALDQLQRTVFIKSEELDVLHKEVGKVTSLLDQLITDFHLFKERVVEIHYLVSYLTSKLMEGRKALQDTGKAWNRGELSSDLFEFLNFTLPCGDDCPVEHGFFHGCIMKEKRDEITLDISVPIVNRSLIRVKADAFDVMLRKANMTCRIKYGGPTIATLSVDEDCVYETHRQSSIERLTLAKSQKCNNNTFSRDENYYHTENCYATRAGDEKGFIEVKIFNNQYHIYCPYSFYVIGKRRVDCPDKVFTLPLSLSFTLNEVEYKGSVLKIVYKEMEDPYFTEHVNYHLTPVINWSNLSSEIDMDWKTNVDRIEKEAMDIPVFKFKDAGMHWSMILLLSVTAIMSIMGISACGVLYMRKKKKTAPKTAEEVPLQEQTNMVNHRIIIE